MTKADFDILTEFEKFFLTAKDGYAGCISSYGLAKLKSIYEKEIKHTISFNPNCTRCKMDLLQKLGDIYFKEKDKRSKKNAKKDK